MKVKALKEYLKEVPDDAEVVLQKDSEGNDYSPLSGVDVSCVYYADTSYSGEIWNNIDPKRPVGAVKAVVLYPTN